MFPADIIAFRQVFSMTVTKNEFIPLFCNAINRLLKDRPDSFNEEESNRFCVLSFYIFNFVFISKLETFLCLLTHGIKSGHFGRKREKRVSESRNFVAHFIPPFLVPIYLLFIARNWKKFYIE